MTPPINIDGTQITGASIDGQTVSEITVDGTTVFSTILDSVLTQDLVAWYRFEDGDARDYTNDLNETFADSTAFDGTVNGATFQSSGGVTDFESGANSGAFDFDGTNDKIDLPSLGFSGSADISVACWANLDTLNDRALFSFGDASNRSMFVFRIFDATDLRLDGFGNDLIVSHNITTGTFSHLVATFDSSTNKAEIYENGSLLGSKTLSTPTWADKNYSIGNRRNASNQFLDGNIDDVRVYNRPLTSSEISDIFNATKP